MTATNNGTCQACGRVHAVTRQGIAKHGYTVQWGYFAGTCPGSGKPPLELCNAFAVQTIADLTAAAFKLTETAQGEIETVPVRLGLTRVVTVTRPEFEALMIERKTPNRTWDSAVTVYRCSLRDEASGLRSHCDFLRDLIARVHGAALQPREVKPAAAPVLRQYARDYREAHGIAARLRDEGFVDVRPRRSDFGFTITYRRAS